MLVLPVPSSYILQFPNDSDDSVITYITSFQQNLFFVLFFAKIQISMIQKLHKFTDIMDTPLAGINMATHS